MSEFLSVELLADCLLIRLRGVFAWEYETIFSTMYFIISTKITSSYNCNHSVFLTYIYIQTHMHK